MGDMSLNPLVVLLGQGLLRFRYDRVQHHSREHLRAKNHRP